MKIKEVYSESQTKRVLDFLFSPNLKIKISKAWISRLFPGSKYPLHSQALIFLAIGLIWYEGIYTTQAGFSFLDILPPIFIILSLVFIDKKKIFLSKFHFWYLAFLAVGLVSGIFAALLGIDWRLIILGWYILAQPLLVMIVGQGFKQSPAYFASILFVPALMLGVYNYFIGAGYGFSSLESVGVRAASIFGGPNIFGMICGLLLSALFGEWLFQKKRHTFLIVALIFGLALSFSRTAWLSTGLGIFILIIFKNWRYLFFSILLPLLFVFPRVRERTLVVFSEKYLLDSSIDGRIWAINNSFYLFKKSFLTGTGPGSYGGKLAQMYSSPVALSGLQQGYPALATTDNQWLSILVQVGFFGVIFLAGFAISFVWEMFSDLNYNKATALAIFIYVMICGFFSNVIEFGALIIPASLFIGHSSSKAK